MSTPVIELSNERRAVKAGKTLGHNYDPATGIWKPIPFTSTRTGDTATRVNEQGLIEAVPANITRWDWSEGGALPSALNEPARTNVALWSEDFTKAQWATSTWGFTTGVTDLNGTNTAIRLTGDGVSSNNAFFQVITGTSGVPYTGSFYIRRVSGSGNIKLRVGDVSSLSSPLALTSDWQRFEFSSTPTTTTVRVGVIGEANSTDVIEVCFGQLEQASYASSYIPTTSSTETRNADNLSATGLGSLLGQSEGTIVAEWKVFKNDSDIKYFELSNGTSNNRTYIYYRNTSIPRVYFDSVVGGTSQIQVYDIPSGEGEDFHKIAFRYAPNNAAAYYNGVEAFSDNTFLTYTGTVLNQINFSTAGGAIPFYGKIRFLAIYDYAMDDTELANITS